MRLAVFVFVSMATSLTAKEWPVIDGTSPSGGQELVTIPIFDTDPPNGTPFRIALRDKASKKILDSFLWEGDKSDSQAHLQNRAYWSPGGQYVAVSMRAGRLTTTTAHFLVEHDKLTRMRPPDAWQNVLGRFHTTKAGPSGGISPIAWVDDANLKVAIVGSAETEIRRIPFHFHATLRFHGGSGVVPWIHLESVEPAGSHQKKDDL